jgi:hypothetical protein
LKVPLTDVIRDLKYLRQQARENIGHYVDDYLPDEFQCCLDTLDMIVYEEVIVENDSSKTILYIG